MLIHKNGTTLDVTKGAFDALFANQGWAIGEKLGEAEKVAKNTNFMSPQPNSSQEASEEESSVNPFFKHLMGESEETEEEDPENLEDEEAEILLEEMTNKELLEYAKEHEIDLSGITKRQERINAIKSAMSEDK